MERYVLISTRYEICTLRISVMYSGSVQITQVDINICQLEQHMEQSNQINNARPLLLKNYDHLEK